MLAEYKYRRLFKGITHDDYLNEPCDVIEWMLRIGHLEAEQMSRQRGGSGGDAGAA